MRVGLISLGCAKNLVDAEIMLGSLLNDGLQVTNDPVQADVLIVNTCSFIDAAQEESVNTILESAEWRDAKNRGQSLIVAGCLPQRFRDELPVLLPEVDAFIGIDQVAQVGDIVKQTIARRAERVATNRPGSIVNRRTATETIVSRIAALNKDPELHAPDEPQPVRGRDRSGKTNAMVSRAGVNGQNSTPESEPLVEVHRRPTFIPDYATPRFRLTPRHFAYLKLAEGCNHPCSFCIIPRMRGSHRSRPQADVLAEARALIADGVRELNLISQDSTYYGLDLRANPSRAISSPGKFSTAARSLPAEGTTLCTLLRALNALPGDFWIRLLYTHPAHWTDELIHTIAECPKVARYVDIPLQHIHDNMLERMRRETSRPYIVELLKKIRAGIPGIALRTTFIVGFPGETDEYFEALLDFIRETRFERLGVFAYSREEGTRAGRMAGQIPEPIKQRRCQRVMETQRTIARELSGSFVGRQLKVLVEGPVRAPELPEANVGSREHGLTRGAQPQNSKLKTQDHLVARGEADAPDIDGRVYIRGRLPAGEFARVRITGHKDYDLTAEPV